jgi:hypothetical protein
MFLLVYGFNMYGNFHCLNQGNFVLHLKLFQDLFTFVDDHVINGDANLGACVVNKSALIAVT